MQANSYHTGVSSSKELNPDKLPVTSQIRIDLDFYSNGNLQQLNIANAHQCDMGEYGRAIHFLEYVMKERTTGPDARVFIRKLMIGLVKIERTRETLGGAAYPAILNPQVPLSPIETPTF